MSRTRDGVTATMSRTGVTTVCVRLDDPLCSSP